MVDVQPVSLRPDSSRATAPVLEVENLHTEFHTSRGVVKAVNGVSFRIEEGELTGVVGESGCGKSVTARSIMGLVKPPGRVVGGSIRLRGTDLLAMDPKDLRRVRGSEMSFIPQSPFGALNKVLPIGRQMVNIVRAHLPESKAEALERSRAALVDVGIAGPDRVLAGYPHELSGGMAQRVVIACGLLLNPGLVIADEPTTGLDVTIQRQIMDLIVEQLATDSRRSMLFVTHDLGIVAQYCQRVVVMYAGRVVEAGPVRSVFGSPEHPYTRALLEAIPTPGRELVSLRGTVPSLIDFPSGCVFADRCDHAHEHCSTVPELRLRPADRQLSCHLPGGVDDVPAQS